MNIWFNPKVRTAIYQALVILGLLWLAYSAVINTQANLTARGIDVGIGFLQSTAGFDIAQTLVPYDQSSTYWDAFWVGLVNTLVVSFVGIILATILGFIFGVMRISKNWLVSRVATAYVETFRNIPLLLQIIFWYEIVLKPLPNPLDLFTEGQAVAFSINNRGFYFPKIEWNETAQFALWALLLGLALTFFLRRQFKQHQQRTGQFRALWPYALLLIMALPAVILWLVQGVAGVETSVMGSFELEGGRIIIPEFMALLVALSVYTAAFIAEVVRSGLNAVAKGQTEAYSSLGLPPNKGLRLVIIPQAMRVIIPPLTNQYLNLTKNSSLAAAIAYPDLVAVFAGTALNQTGRALEIMSITLAIYLMISLLTSVFMNWFNSRFTLAQR